MLPEQFVILAAIINLIGISTYIRDTINGKTKPNKVSWFLWAVAPLIAFFIQRHAGVGWTNLLTFSVGFNPLLVFIASFINKNSYWQITKPDIICGILSIIGILFWVLASSPILAVLFLIIADGCAAIPTLKKSLNFPETESHTAFLFGMTSSTIVLLSIHHFTFLYLAFPIYVLIMDSLLFFFMYPKSNSFLRKYIKV